LRIPSSKSRLKYHSCSAIQTSKHQAIYADRKNFHLPDLPLEAKLPVIGSCYRGWSERIKRQRPKRRVKRRAISTKRKRCGRRENLRQTRLKAREDRMPHERSVYSVPFCRICSPRSPIPKLASTRTRPLQLARRHSLHAQLSALWPLILQDIRERRAWLSPNPRS